MIDLYTPEELERSRDVHAKYILPPGLREAFEGAMTLHQPLLLTGEPGTGKTTLADWAVHHLREKGDRYFEMPLKFHTKTTSKASDLFYTYDALAHFQAANLRGEKTADAAQFIHLQALGLAIALSQGRPSQPPPFLEKLPETPRDTVVLIDEVDKAPRDFTNDILDEIEKYRFRIRELNANNRFEKAEDANIVVILTSNSEKNLPDPFLRRCAFFHIEFPEGEDLRRIVENQLGQPSPAASEALEVLLPFFKDAREKAVRKKPATAELIAWLRLLKLENYASLPEAEKKKRLLQNLGFLVKTQEDFEAVKKLI